MPKYVEDVYDNLEYAASLQGFELLGIRDKVTGRKYIRR